MSPNIHQTSGGILVPGTKWDAVGLWLALNISYWVVVYCKYVFGMNLTFDTLYFKHILVVLPEIENIP